MGEWTAGTEQELSPGSVHRAGPWAVGNVDAAGCLVCPWHGATCDMEPGRMRRGPQGVFARIPGLDAAYRALTRVLPLRRAEVTVRDGSVVVSS